MTAHVSPPTLVGIGVGPGDPELLTVKAIRHLRAASVVLVPETEESDGKAGRAETVVLDAVPEARIQRIPFSMRDRSGVTQRRKQAWLTSAEAALAAFRDGASSVAFATVGDPSVYSTFSYLSGHVVEQMPEVQVEVVPGITAMQALAATSRTPLVEGKETLALVPATAGDDHLREILGVVSTVVAYKGGRRLPEIAELAKSVGREGVVGIQMGMEGQRILALDEAEPGPYFTTVLLPAPRKSIGGGL